jgi:hypothetical protein
MQQQTCNKKNTHTHTHKPTQLAQKETKIKVGMIEIDSMKMIIAKGKNKQTNKQTNKRQSRIRRDGTQIAEMAKKTKKRDGEIQKKRGGDGACLVTEAVFICSPPSFTRYPS